MKDMLNVKSNSSEYGSIYHELGGFLDLLAYAADSFEKMKNVNFFGPCRYEEQGSDFI
ncbi:hypothetical protein MTR_8g010250 [Medicago truncatula]|uniref:Uncharacterized protein n=1 Tax=Medicago truncatula TaxID=3880 RepID=A0A072TKU3_MEDTR|nr:hypothetical protein MTR_8g010250 [Medicago truncatula]